jgi:hypothetical protein
MVVVTSLKKHILSNKLLMVDLSLLVFQVMMYILLRLIHQEMLQKNRNGLNLRFKLLQTIGLDTLRLSKKGCSQLLKTSQFF